MYIPLEKMI